MNDKLRELMVEAGYVAPELAPRAIKLAELIVREASSAIHARNTRVEPAVHIFLLKHFGIDL